MSRPEPLAALSGAAAIPRDGSGPVFPAPWAARAFALAVALNARGVFSWSEWADVLGSALAAEGGDDPEAYWRAWLSALEDVLGRRQVGGAGEIEALQQAWREAAERTPHGEAIELVLHDRSPDEAERSPGPR